MGWISDRGGVGGNPAKTRETNRYPLRKIVWQAVQEDIFSAPLTEFECGHTGFAWGTCRGRCKKCPPIRPENKPE